MPPTSPGHRPQRLVALDIELEVAAAALQAALMCLRCRPTTTGDRARILAALLRELRRTVERAATELLQILGPRELPGPYSAVDPERQALPTGASAPSR